MSTTSLSPLEATLLTRARDQKDETALVELINLHTGIYYTIASQYSRAYPDVIKIDDLTDDRMTNMYQWIISYKDDKGNKLSSYIGDMTDYMCRGILKKEKRNPLSLNVERTDMMTDDTSVSVSVAPSFGREGSAAQADEDARPVGGNDSVYIVDEAPSSHPVEATNTKAALEEVWRLVQDPALNLDPRFKTLLEGRLSDPPVTWRALGKQMGISYEMCRKVYLRDVAKLRARTGMEWLS